MDTQKKLQAVDLSCVRQQKKIFSDLSFHISSAELLVVEGANGAGKSSLLRLLASLATPATGDIQWCGESIYHSRLNYQNHLHYIGHHNGIKLGLTVNENLLLAGHLRLSSANNMNDILHSLNLHSERNKIASYLSAGQKRRLALAKLFLYPKSLWIIDEPLTALDANTQHFFLNQLHEHIVKGGMAIISSHHAIYLPTINLQTMRLPIC